MVKFFGLVIGVDSSVQKVWMNADHLKSYLKNKEVCCVYRTSTDQIAKLDQDDQIVWIDVAQCDAKTIT